MKLVESLEMGIYEFSISLQACKIFSMPITQPLLSPSAIYGIQTIIKKANIPSTITLASKLRVGPGNLVFKRVVMDSMLIKIL